MKTYYMIADWLQCANDVDTATVTTTTSTYKKGISQGLSSWEAFSQLITIIVIFLVILVIAYYATKLLGGMQSRYQKGKGGNLEIIEVISISTGKTLQLIRMGEKYVVVAVTKDRVETITELPSEQVHILLDEGKKSGVKFEALFSRISGKKK